MKRIERMVLAALDAAGPKSHAVAIYEVIARGRINPITYKEFCAVLNRLAGDPDEVTRTINEMTLRHRRVFWLTRAGRRAVDNEGVQDEAI